MKKVLKKLFLTYLILTNIKPNQLIIYYFNLIRFNPYSKKKNIVEIKLFESMLTPIHVRCCFLKFEVCILYIYIYNPCNQHIAV